MGTTRQSKVRVTNPEHGAEIKDYPVSVPRVNTKGEWEETQVFVTLPKGETVELEKDVAEVVLHRYEFVYDEDQREKEILVAKETDKELQLLRGELEKKDRDQLIDMIVSIQAEKKYGRQK